MASVDEMRKALNDLVNSDGEVSLPGLEFEPVVENIVEKKYADQLQEADKVGERDNVKAQLKKYYETTMKEEVDNSIQQIKSSFGSVKTMVAQLQEAITSAVASNAIPAVITVGSATSTPNPAYTLIENKTKKNTLLTAVKTCETLLISLLTAAICIMFEVPSSVITLIGTLSAVKTAVNAIPV